MITIIYNNKIIQCTSIEEAKSVIDILDSSPMLSASRITREYAINEISSTPMPSKMFLENEIEKVVARKEKSERKNQAWQKNKAEFFILNIGLKPKDLAERLNRTVPSVRQIKWAMFKKNTSLPKIFQEILAEKKGKLILNKS